MNAIFLVSMILPLSIVFIVPFSSKKFRAQMAREPMTAIMFAVAALLTLAIPFITEISVRTHNFAVLEDLMLGIGVFALVGIAYGVARSIRMSRVVKNRI